MLHIKMEVQSTATWQVEGLITSHVSVVFQHGNVQAWLDTDQHKLLTVHEMCGEQGHEG